MHGAATTTDYSTGAEVFEPFLPEDVAGTKGNFALDENTHLLQQLNAMHRNEFLHHGYEHSGQNGLCEFESRDTELLAHKLQHGREILRRCFNQAPKTFVAPQDKYSPEALRLIQSRFETFSLGWIDRSRLPHSIIPKYVVKKLLKRNSMRYGDTLLTEHPGCHYSQYVSRELSDAKLDAALNANPFTIIVTHHWEFFDQGKLIHSMWDAFKSRILALQADRNTQLITFSQLRALAQ
ncbi:hypothetical protein A3767_16415 [Oleiphilus sp. HI0133]|nr:hypothetical protein A3767_16415 [Oleiphilus sp. HI0133]